MPDSPPPHSPSPLEKKLLSIIQAFLLDLGNERAIRSLAYHASLDKDLGLGSIERVELLVQIEKKLNIQLPERLLLEANTVAQLVSMIEKTSTANRQPINLREEKTEERKQLPPIETSIVSGLSDIKTLTEVLEIYAKADPERPHIYLHTEEGEEQIVRYGQFFHAASICAYGLLESGIQPHDAIAI